MDKLLISADHAKKHGVVDTGHLSKIWKINIEASEWTLGVNTQQIQRTENTKLLRNNGTNNSMLRGKRIHEYSFMDILFPTKEAV